MVIIVQLNLGRGFLDYVNQSDRDRLDALSVIIGEHFQKTGSWQFVLDERRWNSLTRGSSSGPFGDRPARRPPLPPPPPQPRSTSDRAASAPPPGSRHAGKRPGRPPPPEALSFSHRVSLFDANNQQLSGRPISPRASVYRAPVMSNGSRVGTLAIVLSKALSGNRDLNFLQQQYRGLIMIALTVLVLATGLAWWLALNLTRPLMQTVNAVRKLAEGNYSERLDSRRRDEVGSLARDIDVLSQSLDENQRSRQRWISDISHELRTPLAIIRGELEAVREGVRPPTMNTIESLHAEAIRLGQLIDDLHELAMADRGALTYSMNPTNLGMLLVLICKSFSASIQQANLRLIYDSSCQSGPIIMGDARRLNQLFGNLLENSLRYTDSGGCIEVQVRQSLDRVTVTVTDSEPGVSEAECERLFERLYRVESSRSRALGGSGLGLSICKSITEAHDGSIRAAPATAGGLMVTLTFPLAKS